MARVNKPKLTEEKNISEIENSSGDIEFLATFTINGRRYIEKNLTILGEATTLTQAKK